MEHLGPEEEIDFDLKRLGSYHKYYIKFTFLCMAKREGVKKEYSTVRRTVRVDPRPPPPYD